MKRTYIKPAIQAKNIHITIICSSSLGMGSGSAEDAQKSGWSLNSKSYDLELSEDDMSSLPME